MIGRNIQYFRRMAAMARSCSARSVKKRALPSVQNKPDRDFVWLPGLASVMGQPSSVLSGYPPQSCKFSRFHKHLAALDIEGLKGHCLPVFRDLIASFTDSTEHFRTQMRENHPPCIYLRQFLDYCRILKV